MSSCSDDPIVQLSRVQTSSTKQIGATNTSQISLENDYSSKFEPQTTFTTPHHHNHRLKPASVYRSSQQTDSSIL